MNDKPDSLEEAIEEVAETASNTAENMDDLAQSVVEQAPEVIDAASDLGQVAEDIADSTGSAAEGFEERLEELVSDAGNFMAGDISVDPGADESDKLWSAAAYFTQIFIPVIVPILMLVIDPNKDRPFQKYHAAQSLGFLVAEFVYQVLAGIVFVILSAITLGCLAPVLWLIFLLPVIPAIYYAYLAYQGKRFKMPWVTDFMSEQGWL
jgi:uncharacterized membrane protein